MWVVACTTRELTPPKQWWGQAAGKSFLFARRPHQELPRPVPSAGVSYLLVLTNGKSVVWPCPDNVPKPAMDMGMIGFSQDDFFFFKY